ncbi:MAG TPA: hypothetical protein VK957_04410 [Lunatimonas sp.]|nr:hypothetical protein [Lunatimonas sp.]
MPKKLPAGFENMSRPSDFGGQLFPALKGQNIIAWGVAEAEPQVKIGRLDSFWQRQGLEKLASPAKTQIWLVLPSRPFVEFPNRNCKFLLSVRHNLKLRRAG